MAEEEEETVGEVEVDFEDFLVATTEILSSVFS